MVRCAKWMSSLAVGMVLSLEGFPAHAQTSSQGEPTPALLRPIGGEDHPRSERTADFVVVIPNGDDVDPYQAPQPADAPGPIDAESMDDSRPSDTEVPRRDDGADATDSDDAETEVINERYPNGSLKIEREVTQDVQGNYLNHGLWKMWDPNGNIISQGEHWYGSRTGTWIRWYRNPAEAGLLSKAPYQQYSAPYVSQATFKDGQIDGAWEIFDAKTRKISRWEFSDGKRHGTSTWWYSNGHKMREVNYRDGALDGQYLEWGTDGSVVVNETYESGRRLGSKVAQHPGGGKKSEGMYLFAKEVEQTPDDWWKCKPQVTMKQGKDEKHGPSTSWFTNGQRQTEGTYEYDVQVGRFTWWHSNGQVALEGKFEHGKQDGPWTWWYSSGQKSIQGEYVKGNPTGRWTWWKEDGKVAQSADLSRAEGVVIDSLPVPNPDALPQAAAPRPRLQPARR